EEVRGNGLFDLAVGDELSEVALVGRPVAIHFLVTVEQLLRRRQVEEVYVLDSGDGAQEVSEVVALGEPGELRVVVQPDVHDALHAAWWEHRKESLGRLLRELDGEELNGGHG